MWRDGLFYSCGTLMTETSDFWSKLPVMKKILTSGLIREFVSVDR